MPYPSVEDTRTAIKGEGLLLALRGVDLEMQPISFASLDDQHFESREDITFPRSRRELALTEWGVYQGDRLIAYDKLERPILLRAGERATFPPGAIKMELR